MTILEIILLTVIITGSLWYVFVRVWKKIRLFKENKTCFGCPYSRECFFGSGQEKETN